MNVTVYPGSADGVVAAPPCRDEALQAIILASITNTAVRASGSTPGLFNALFEMGARFRQQDDVISFYNAPKESHVVLNCSHEVTMLLLPLCAVIGGEYTFLGVFDSDLAKALGSVGIECATDGTGLTVKGRLKTERIILADEKLLRGFLLVLPLLKDTKIVYNGSRTQANFELQILQRFGYGISETDGYSLQRKTKEDTGFIYNVGGDYGSAAYYLLHGFVGREAGVTGLLADTAQPKRCVIEELKGCRLSVQELYGAVFAKKSRFKAEMIDINRFSEPAVMLLLACLGRGRCVIKNSGLLQANIKEEFEQALEGLKSIGADIMSIGSDIHVGGKKKLYGGTADAKKSKNLSLVFSAAALASETGVNIKNCADISELRTLGISL